MERFTALFASLDETNKTLEKVAAMERYFREAPAEDAAWGLFFLSGGRLRGTVKTNAMRDAVLEAAGLPGWMLDECYEAVGDLSETAALLLPDAGVSQDAPPLHVLVPELVLPLITADAVQAKGLLQRAWRGLSRPQRFVFNKLVRGNFRVGVQRALVVRALAQATGMDVPIIAHRLSGGFEPTAEAFASLSEPAAASDSARPYPFCLAHQLGRSLHELGDSTEWQVEFKWDGIRAQVVRRDAIARGVAVWSRGEEPIGAQFPELAAGARVLPSGTVLDGEILAWRFGRTRGEGRPLSFNALQTRLNRKDVQPSLFDAEGVVFAAFDLLEESGRDCRGLPLRERRAVLERLFASVAGSGAPLILPPAFVRPAWADVEAIRATARDDHGAEGLMLKHLGSAYHVGRVAGGTAESTREDGGLAAGWWKWKVNPYSVDAVLIYAQQGSGRRAGLFTDYTFGVWDPDPSGKLVAFAKAYSGLSNEEIARVDAFVRANTIDRKGPVRMVKPEMVFEISFESIRASPRHKAGVAVRFPRITRWRADKTPEQADTLGTVRAILEGIRARDV